MIRKAASFFRSFDLEKTPSKMAKVELSRVDFSPRELF